MQEERDLVEKARLGDRQAFRSLVERYQRRVFGLAYDLTGNMHDAEDLSQEVFVRMYRFLPRFRGDSKLSTWLYRITVNTCISRFGSRKASMERNHESLDILRAGNRPAAHEDCAEDMEKKAENSQLQSKIREALGVLSGREKAVFAMRHFHGIRFAEIGEAMNMAVGTVKTLNHRALKKVRKRLRPLALELGKEGANT